MPNLWPRLAYRGGNWNNGANNGVFSFNANNARSNVNTNIGGRSALALLCYTPNPRARGAPRLKGYISLLRGASSEVKDRAAAETSRQAV